MAEQPAAERTEQPTPKKLEKARSKGQTPQSQEFSSVVTLLVLVGSVSFLAPNLAGWVMMQVREGLSGSNSAFCSNAAFVSFINRKIIESMAVMFPILAALTAGSMLASIAIGGLNFAPEAVRLRWDLINPSQGLQRLINTRSFVHLLASVLKLLVISVIVWFYLSSQLHTLAALRWAWSEQIVVTTGKIILGLMIRVGIALLVLAIADSFYQKWKYIQDLKMTRQEVKQEHRDTEGSPEVKARIRRIQFGMAMRRISAEVPKASVVLVNPEHVAVALRYEADTMESPVVVAKGADYLAEKVREIARAYGVPIVRRPELARTIYSTVKVGSSIPESLYLAVAEVLAMIYRLRHRTA